MVVAAVLLLVPVTIGLHGRWPSPPASYDQAQAAKIPKIWAADSERRRAQRAAWEAALVHVAVVGDSYTEGSGMGGVADQSNWTTATASLLWSKKRIPAVLKRHAAGGSGYMVRGSRNVNFPDLVEAAVAGQPDYVVVFGSRNDITRNGVEERAAAAYATIRKEAPQARLIVIGPPWINEHLPNDIIRVRDEVRSAALRAGADFVDPLQERWFFGPDAKLIGTDGVHPTDAGHAYMGAKITDKLASLLADHSIVDAVPLA